MRVSLVCTLLSAGWSAEDTSYFRTLKLTALKKFVYVRGEDCSSCSTKEDWAAKAAQVAPKPMDLELEKEWKTQQAYKKQLKDYEAQVQALESELLSQPSSPWLSALALLVMLFYALWWCLPFLRAFLETLS